MNANTQQAAEVATARNELASPFTDKRGYAQRWSASRRWVDSMIAQGLPCIKTSARRVRLCIPECDEWMTRKFRVQRRGPVAAGGAK